MSATLPELAVNRSFMAEFLDAEPPCFALGLVEMGGTRCALVALRPEQSIPRHVTAGGFRFGHSMLGGIGWEVVHFGFEFYGFRIYNALVNPSDPVARAVLGTMVGTGDYFFFALRRRSLGHDGLPVKHRDRRPTSQLPKCFSHCRPRSRLARLQPLLGRPRFGRRA